MAAIGNSLIEVDSLRKLLATKTPLEELLDIEDTNGNFDEKDLLWC